MNKFDVNKISVKDMSTNVYTERNYKLSTEYFADFKRRGYSDEEAIELVEWCAIYPDIDVDSLDNLIKNLIKQFNEIGCTSFQLTADELRKSLK